MKQIFLMAVLWAIMLFLWFGCAKPQLFTEMVESREDAIAASMVLQKKFSELHCKNIKTGLVREENGVRLIVVCVEYGDK